MHLAFIYIWDVVPNPRRVLPSTQQEVLLLHLLLFTRRLAGSRILSNATSVAKCLAFIPSRVYKLVVPPRP